ncbi:hypothetical protein B6U84_05415 [Candidatus Bathyarchaeota archaeon ex4484_40]|nr:MAG: hypothetical protein B6U84_05415 [Candidatus Bathyarchaeota archaeon ex4484_40]
MNRIRGCKRLLTSKDRIECLKDLLKEFGEDGMILYELGSEYEGIGEYENALNFYNRAKEKFPLRKYQMMALEAAERVGRLLDEFRESMRTKPQPAPSQITTREDILYVVNCTKKKVWNEYPNAPPYVPARFAYKGKSFLKFLSFIKPKEKQGVRWLILSAKYGFLEPWHPISDYNVSFNDPNSGPISDETLRKQVSYQKRWRDKKPLKDFVKVFVYAENDVYYEKVLKAYEGIAEVKRLYDLEE